MRSTSLLVLALCASAVGFGCEDTAIAPEPPPFFESSDSVLVGAGDVASCSSTGDEATAAIIDTIPGVVFAAGDLAYQNGTQADFQCYDASWGRFKERTMPVPGNHEYNTRFAAPYFQYFGERAGNPGAGYYAYRMGSWRIFALNSNIAMGANSPQLTWLTQQLASVDADCTLAYWHHPLFSSGEHGNQGFVRPVWDALYAAGADVVLNGHDHDYERFAPQSPGGQADAQNGIREFVVGTGGRSKYIFLFRKPNSETRISDSYGVLRIVLHARSYEWQFITTTGIVRDSGTAGCHSAQ